MTPFNESQRDKNKNIFAELTTSPNVGRLWLTFELDDLSVLCLGQSFETHLAGQCQTDTTAAQQETNLLTACVLQRETKVRTSHETLGDMSRSETFQKYVVKRNNGKY